VPPKSKAPAATIKKEDSSESESESDSEVEVILKTNNVVNVCILCVLSFCLPYF
jgi:hypothetical protein